MVSFADGLSYLLNSHQIIRDGFLQDSILHSTCDEKFNDLHPCSFASGLVENDTYHMGDMLKQPEKKDFINAI